MSQNNNLGYSIVELQNAINWSQSEMTSQVRVSYTQIGRYETMGSQHTAVLLKKFADILITTVDFLINGNTEDNNKASLVNAEVIGNVNEVDALTQENNTTLLCTIGGFIRDVKTKLAYASCK